jgi:hypothetical protein
LDTTNPDNYLEIQIAAEWKKLNRMAKVHEIVEMWPASQNLCSTLKESRPENKQMTAVGFISDTEEIFQASWSNI